MITNTKYFGKFEYAKKDIIIFENGLFGYDNERNFILIKFDIENDNLLCMQSVENENLAFVVVNPFLICESYDPKLSDEDKKLIYSETNDIIAFYSICVIGENLDKTTVNLRCPIAINTKNNIAKQFILENKNYSFKYPFTTSKTKGAI